MAAVQPRASGLDGLDLDLEAERANPSLGVPETALLRRINKAANDVVEPAHYRPLVRELLAHQTLSRRTGSPRLALPPEVHGWAQEVAASWRTEIEQRGYDVVGDLGDLTGPPPRDPWADPDRPSEKQVAGAAVDALRALLLENARLRGSEAAPRRRAPRDAGGAGALLPAPDLPVAREDRAPARRTAAPAAAC